MGLFNFLFKKEQVEEKVVEKKEETKLLEKKTEPQVVAETETPEENKIQVNTIENRVEYSPTTFEDIKDIILLMKYKKTNVLVNLKKLNKHLAQRFLDVLCGAITALDGEVKSQGKMVYYFAPNTNK